MPISSRSQPKRLATQLLAEAPPAQASTLEDLARVAENSLTSVPRARMIPIERIAPSGDNPRKNFSHIEELAESIALTGILQPLLVRRDIVNPGYYKLIAGERRLQAAHRVRGFEDPAARARVEILPCVIRDENDENSFADSLAENVARNDLTRAEMMNAYQRLRDDYGWGVRQIARRTGRSIGDVSELLSLSNYPYLAALVQEEVIAATTASEIRRLPVALRARAIEGVKEGKIAKIADVQKLRREFKQESEVPFSRSEVFNIEHPMKNNSDETSVTTVFNSEQKVKPLQDTLYTKKNNFDGLKSIKEPLDSAIHLDVSPYSSTLVLRQSTNDLVSSEVETDQNSTDTTLVSSNLILSILENKTSILTKLDSLIALTSVVDENTVLGREVLISINHDLTTAYNKIATYLRHCSNFEK